METFTHVVFNGLRYQISSIVHEKSFFVSTGTVKELGPIVMWVYQNGYKNYAYLGHFFYDRRNKLGNHEIDKSAFFKKIVGEPGEIAAMDAEKLAQLEKQFADDIFKILCMIARFYKCKVITLNDSSMSNGFPMCNYRYKGPNYVNYYGKKGFIECAIDEKRYPLKLLAMGAAVKEGNKQILTHQTEAKMPFNAGDPKAGFSNEQAVAAYYNYKRAIPANTEPYANPLPNCSIDMARYMDDANWMVWEYDTTSNTSMYKAQAVPFTVKLIGTELVIDGIDRSASRRIPIKKIK